MAKKYNLIPNDFRDFLSILSFLGFIAIFLLFALNFDWLSNNLNALFLMVAGLGLMVVGKVFTIRQWARDGIQSNETSRILSGTIGLASLIFGILLFTGIGIGEKFTGFVGILAMFPAIFILFDYVVKNRR